MRVRSGIAIAVAVAACGRGAKDTPAAEERRAAPAAAPRVRHVDTLADLLAPGGPSIPAPFSEIELGMTIDQARKAAPELFAFAQEISNSYEIKWSRLPGIVFLVSYDLDERVSYVYLRSGGKREQVREELVRLWGEPIDHVALSATQNSADEWVNPRDHLRALLWMNDEPILAFERYLPLAELLGGDPARLAFERVPILGSDRATLQRAFGADYHASRRSNLDEISLPPTEATAMSDRTDVDLEFDDGGRVKGYSICLDDFVPGRAGAGPLEQLWGPPATADDPEHRNRGFLVYREADPRVTLLQLGDPVTCWMLSVER